MKKVLFFMVIAICLATFEIKAQTAATAEKTEEVAQETSTSEAETDGQSGGEFGYLGIENGSGFGWNIVFKHILLTYAFTSGDNNDYMKNISGWRAGLGYNYRYNITKFLYIEGHAAVAYYHNSYEYPASSSGETRGSVPSAHGYGKTPTEWEKESNGDFGMFVSPRIGLNIYKGIGIVAGYHWDFAKFKFSKEYTTDYFTVGIAITN
ncbi:MAG: hypothetical protein LBL97_03465 [Prevotellaceae bacterium]|jgi:hypothetical protein|nr:hypothetical protein [Prevotellaceae bacterium]